MLENKTKVSTNETLKVLKNDIQPKLKPSISIIPQIQHKFTVKPDAAEQVSVISKHTEACRNPL